MLVYLFFPPFFLYAPSLYYLLKSDDQKRIIGLAVAQMVISIVLGLLLVYNLKLTGGLAAATMGQWIAAIVFFREFQKVRTVKI